MNTEQLFKYLQSDKIKLDAKAHYISKDYMMHQLEWKVSHNKDMRKKYQDLVDKGIEEDNGASAKSMLSIYKRDLEEEIAPWKAITTMEPVTCAHCQSRLYLMLKEDGTLTFIETGVYWAIGEARAKETGNKRDKHGVAVTEDQIPRCKAEPLLQAGKLVARINAPSGRFIFQNFFREDKLNTFPKEINEHRDENSINGLLGRNNLMQYLATQNVGYGQMGNMSVAIYSNGKDEILVVDPYMEDAVADIKYELKHAQKNPDRYSEEDIQKLHNKQAFYDKVFADLKAGGFKRKGDSISLSVWRWQCADKQILEEHGENLEIEDYNDQVELKVRPGVWEIEHYFDFTNMADFGEEWEDPIFSRLRLVEPLKKSEKE